MLLSGIILMQGKQWLLTLSCYPVVTKRIYYFSYKLDGRLHFNRVKGVTLLMSANMEHSLLEEQYIWFHTLFEKNKVIWQSFYEL